MVGKQILEKAQLQVDVANDGLTAVKMVKECKYDTILMDIQMPIMDGYIAAKEIRKIQHRSSYFSIVRLYFYGSKRQNK